MVSFGLLSSTLVVVSSDASVETQLCSLNGVYRDGACECDAGWTGAHCAELNLASANPGAHGLDDPSQPTWGGTAIFESGRWHLLVGALAVPNLGQSNWGDDYPCNSKIVRAVSASADPAGPYSVEEVFTNRSSWEIMLTRGPEGELVAMFYGNQSNPVPVGSPECVGGDVSLLSHSTYVTVSAGGSVTGPWTTPQLVHGMENRLGGSVLIAGHGRVAKDACSWRCANGNPGPAFHPNGTLFALMRSNTCDPKCSTKEHVSLWRADEGWSGEWTLVMDEPVLGWGDATAETCKESGDNCTQAEDPYLWIDERGWHMLAHYQNNNNIRNTRGLYAWSLDGLDWTLETLPRRSNASAWEPRVAWTNGSTSPTARRQRVSLIRDISTGQATHVLNGADFWLAGDGCHWGTGISLIQPLRAKDQAAVV